MRVHVCTYIEVMSMLRQKYLLVRLWMTHSKYVTYCTVPSGERSLYLCTYEVPYSIPYSYSYLLVLVLELEALCLHR